MFIFTKKKEKKKVYAKREAKSQLDFPRKFNLPENIQLLLSSLENTHTHIHASGKERD